LTHHRNACAACPLTRTKQQQKRRETKSDATGVNNYFGRTAGGREEKDRQDDAGADRRKRKELDEKVKNGGDKNIKIRTNQVLP
jgi:hypothetical protein